MIKILQKEFLDYYGLTGTQYHVPFYTSSGDIIEHDEKACRECKKKEMQQCYGDNEKQNLIIHSKHEITVIDIETFLNQFIGRKAGTGRKCDLIAYDLEKILFVDMYCGYQKGLIPHDVKTNEGIKNKSGKIADAREQITSTFDKLYVVPSLQTKLDSFKVKEGLFANRKKKYSNDEDKVMRNMGVFMEIAALSSRGLYSNLSHDIKFMQIDYPEKYNW